MARDTAERAEIDETPRVDRPETRYAKSGGVNVAYQVVGHGPFDLVFVPGWASHVELAWKVPSGARLLRGLAEFSRLIRFDKRGTGMSDRLTESMTFEQRMDDIRAVMDAVGSERAALMGISEGASMSILFAATYPQRATALVLCGGQAKTMSAPDYPLGSSVESVSERPRKTRRTGASPAGSRRLPPGHSWRPTRTRPARGRTSSGTRSAPARLQSSTG